MSSGDASLSDTTELSEEDESSMGRHQREARLQINRILAKACPGGVVPIYSAMAGDEEGRRLIRAFLPPKTVMVNGETGEIKMLGTDSSQKRRASDEPPEPVMTVSTAAPFSDMSAIARITRNGTTAIYFENVNPKDVWLLFKFYREISGDTGKNDVPVSNAVRESALNMRDSANHALFSLGAILGAGIFLDAIRTPTDSFPEVSMTKTMIQTTAELKRRVPFVVIPRLTSETYTPDALPAVILDGKAGTYVVSDSLTKSIKSRFKKKSGPSHQSQDPLSRGDCMLMATYMNLTTLYKLHSNPKLVVFANVDPSAVLGVIGFYERMVDPDSDLDPSEERQIIYSSLEALGQPSMVASAKDWMLLAKRSGAVPFETLLRRNL